MQHMLSYHTIRCAYLSTLLSCAGTVTQHIHTLSNDTWTQRIYMLRQHMDMLMHRLKVCPILPADRSSSKR